MLHIGLTGNIATGKSSVSRYFVELGATVIDADAVAHELLETDTPTARRVVEAFGPEILCAAPCSDPCAAPCADDPRGLVIDRRRLGAIVFAAEEKRLLLNSIVHPAIYEALRVRVAAAERLTPAGVIIVDAALLVETGGYRQYERLIVVRCAPEQQLERLMRRDGLTATAARARIVAQMPMEEKVRFADYVIDNSGPLAATRAQAATVYERLRVAAASDIRSRSRAAGYSEPSKP